MTKTCRNEMIAVSNYQICLRRFKSKSKSTFVDHAVCITRTSAIIATTPLSHVAPPLMTSQPIRELRQYCPNYTTLVCRLQGARRARANRRRKRSARTAKYSLRRHINHRRDLMRTDEQGPTRYRDALGCR